MYLKKIFIMLSAVVALVSMTTGCGDSKTGIPEPDKIVPQKNELVENLTDNGYSVEIFDTVLDTDFSGKRVYAEKDDKYIDICYELSASDAETLFRTYENKYQSGDYYIIAQNGNYVYAVSDKKTFKISGFESTDNVGQQDIRE